MVYWWMTWYFTGSYYVPMISPSFRDTTNPICQGFVLSRVNLLSSPWKQTEWLVFKLHVERLVNACWTIPTSLIRETMKMNWNCIIYLLCILARQLRKIFFIVCSNCKLAEMCWPLVWYSSDQGVVLTEHFAVCCVSARPLFYELSL